MECIKVAGESIARSLGNFNLEASVQTDAGFPGFGSLPASNAFQKSEKKKRIIEQKFFGNCFFGLFKNNIRDIGNIKNVLLWIDLETYLGGVSACNETFFKYFLKKNFLHTWS